MRRLLPLMVLLVAGCSSASEDGGAEPDRAQWSKELSAEGVEVTNWRKWETKVAPIFCDTDPDDLETYVAVGMDRGENLDVVRINIKYACPELLDDWDHAVAEVRSLNR